MANRDELFAHEDWLKGSFYERVNGSEFCPDFARLHQELMRGGIWRSSALDDNLRILVTISTQCVNGQDFGLQDHIRMGLSIGMSPRKIKGIFIQLLFYVGIPATVFGLLETQKVINDNEKWKKLDVPIEENWLNGLGEKLQEAQRTITKHWGPEANAEIENSLTQQMVPEAADIVDGYNFGEIWTHSDLEPKERMVCILASLVARSHLDLFRKHTRYALNMGFSSREICEVVAIAGWYRGWPFVEDALSAAYEILSENQ